MSSTFNLNDDQRDTLTEILNMGVGGAAEVLHQMMGEYIDLSVPNIYLLSSNSLTQEVGEDESEKVAVKLGFKGSVEGNAFLLFPAADAIRLAGLLLGENIDKNAPEAEWSETVTEVGNIVVNSVMGAVANTFNEVLHYSVPQFDIQTPGQFVEKNVSANKESTVVVAEADMKICSASMTAKILIIFSVSSFEHLEEHLDRVYAESVAA